MSIPIQSPPSLSGVYQAHFGSPPGSQDAKVECEKWQLLCGELLTQRERLRAELDKERIDRICAEWDKEPIPSMEEVFAEVDRTTTIEQLIADFKLELEAEK